jgi:hypothetical protein
MKEWPLLRGGNERLVQGIIFFFRNSDYLLLFRLSVAASVPTDEKLFHL